jgi:DNA-binding NarL/FixJ family response regulator
MISSSFLTPPKGSAEPITVLLADDHPVVRSGIRRELEKQADIQVVGEAVDGQEAIALVESLLPDVLLIDINMPYLNGVEVVEKLNERRPVQKPTLRQPFVLGLSAYCEPEYVYRFFAAGAKGYLLKDEPPQQIIAGVRRIIAGEPVLSLPIQSLLLRRRLEPRPNLSPRETEVLQLMAKGFTNGEIADKLVIAEGTVKNHVTNIYKRLEGPRTRAEAVAWAWENGLVKG